MPLDKLQPSPSNPRKDLQPGDPEYEHIRRSIEEFDLVEPLIWNKRTGRLLGGHQRLKVLRELGREEAEVSVVDLDDKQEKTLMLALNRVQGGWDDQLLGSLLRGLGAEGGDLDLAGFDGDEVAALLSLGGGGDKPVDLDSLLTEYDMEKAVAKPIWAVVRVGSERREELERALSALERQGIRVERSYEE